MTAEAWCVHCDADPKAYANGLCQACDKYQRKYDRLPPTEVLVKRQRRRDSQRDEAKITNRPAASELQTIGNIGKLRERLGQESLHPIEGLLVACDKAAVTVVALEYVTGLRGSFLGRNRFDEDVIHPLTALYGEWLDRWGRLQKLALDAGIDQQRLNLAEGNARTVLEAVSEGLNDAGLNPAQQEVVRGSIARRLRTAQH